MRSAQGGGTVLLPPLSPFSQNASAPVMHAWPESFSCKPSFMIIGAPKCGSTSLFKYIEAHPDVRPPERKELCYFSKFKRYLTRYSPMAPASNWPFYVAAFAGHRAVGAASQRVRLLRSARSGAGTGQRSELLAHDLSALLGNWELAGACRGGKAVPFEGCPFYLHEHLAAAQIHSIFPALKAMAVLRHPRERSISAFNDYVRMGRIRVGNSAVDRDHQLQCLIEEKIGLLRRGERSLEDFDVRILTSAVYIYGLSEWGRIWPREQLLVLQAEEMFENTESVMHRVQDFLGLRRAIPDSAYAQVHNRNTLSQKARASAELNAILDGFFAPYNEHFYDWMRERSLPYKRWMNASDAGRLENA